VNSILNWWNQLGQSDFLFWLIAAVLLAAIIGIGYGVKYFGEHLFKSDKAKTIWNKLMNWVILFVVVVFIFTYLPQSSWMYETLFELGNTSITPLLILAVVFSVFIAFKISRTLRSNILPGVYSRYHVEKSVQATINTLLHYSIVTIMLLLALNSLGFSLTSLTVFAGVLGVGVGFGLQNIMNNFISGLIILFDRPIKVGDRVVIDETIIDIERIKIRNTIGHTRANERIIIPNSYFLENRFINRSYSDKRLRIIVSLSVPYETDLHLATELMEGAVYELSRTKWKKTMRHPEPKVFIEEFAEYDITMDVWFWIDDQANEFEFIIPSDVRYLIYNKFKENGVEFSYPRQEVFVLNNKEKEAE